MHLERFQVDDLLLINLCPPQKYPGFLNARHVERGMAYTLWQGNTPLGAAGITTWPLCHEAWAYLSTELVQQRPLVLQTLVKRLMPFFARVLQTKDLIARVPPGNRRTARWPESLGMKFVYTDEDGYLTYRRQFDA